MIPFYDCKSIKPIEDYDYIMKCIIIGDSGVGKTSIMTRLINETFSVNSAPTIGIDFGTIYAELSKSCLGGEPSDKKSFKLQIWDCAGQVRFRSIVKSYFRQANMVILVYDVTHMESFHNAKEWYNLVKEELADQSYVVCLIGNKMDLLDDCFQEDLITGLAQKFAEENKIDMYTFVSAKSTNGDEIREPILEGVIRVYDLHVTGKLELSEPCWKANIVDLHDGERRTDKCFDGCAN
jgi:small GTP-binding protein